MPVMLIAFDGTTEFGQFLGDTITSIKAAELFLRAHPVSKCYLTLHQSGQLNFLWQKLIDKYNIEVILNSFDAGNADQRFAAWNTWRKERNIGGEPFDIYKELYRRIDGGHRQPILAGSEAGLGRKNIFEYFYYGQEPPVIEPCVGGDEYRPGLIYYKLAPPHWDVWVSPAAKCQGNGVFTFQFWDAVVRKLVAQGVKVTVGHNGEFCEDLAGSHYRRIFPPYRDLVDEIARHRLLTCGNTGTGWIAASVGTPLLSMQPPDSNMQDYRYEWCGVKSLIEYVDTPDVDYVVRRIVGELDKRTVLTVCPEQCMSLDADDVRHLEEARSLGTRLVVATPADEDSNETILKGLRAVDEVRRADALADEIELIRPAVVALDGRQVGGIDPVMRSFVESYGGKVVQTTGKPVTIDFAPKVAAAITPTATEVARAVQAAAPRSPNPPAKLRLLADQFLSVASLAGDLADVGAYRGAGALILRKLAPSRQLHLFDTWSGNPHNDPLCHHKVGEWAADLDECKRTVGVNAMTHYHQGVFPASAESVKDRRFAFVFIDVDTYQSTRAAIEFFWPRMVEGGKMVIDDVPWEPCAGVEKAVKELLEPGCVRIHGSEHMAVAMKG